MRSIQQSGMADECVQRAFLLLEGAGHMDLVKTEALSQLRSARKALEGVAAAVWAYSSLRRGRSRDEQVRCGGRGLGQSRGGAACLGSAKEGGRQLWWAALGCET
ncbi:hypothetical protein NDU88_009858 [Pleurodeles waltl]|uniref:Uncharacterized protein n=1 Tax=Pleurodeles waltl TaxID=8319 RepID=A0AAV7PWI5_PLEWA|nr:hypothetical protein NDU88_009858 [Pleurodeles waltl]